MTLPGAQAVAWYFSTAGVGPDDGYRWLAADPRHDATTAEVMLHAPVAGTSLLGLTSEVTPSIVMSKVHDGGFVFYANRLAPPGAPEKGDLQRRPISASVLGIAPPDADPSPLIAAAVAALRQELARCLPLTWTAGSPKLVSEAESWPPPGRDALPQPQAAGQLRVADLEESVGLNPAKRDLATTALASLSAADLEAFQTDRVLLVQTTVLELPDLERLRPWRAISPAVPTVKEQVTFLRESKSAYRWQLSLGLIALAVLATVLVAVFY
jgi:hypothetical protein